MMDIIKPFKNGDIVQLNSGGPAMTVSRQYQHQQFENPTVGTVWFDGGECRRADFSIETLRTFEAEALRFKIRFGVDEK